MAMLDDKERNIRKKRNMEMYKKKEQKKAEGREIMKPVNKYK